VTLVLVVASIAEIHAQSSGYRRSIDAGYGALAARVVDASNQTGTQLAAVMDSAPSLTNQALPRTARAVLEQGLDAAVAATAQEADQAAHLVPPYPTDQVSDQFADVMAARATGTADLRHTVDQLLGMTPLPIAGAPAASVPPAPAVLISIGQATTSMANAGQIFQQSDADFANLTAQIRKMALPIHLPRSVWVPVPVASAPLGPPQLASSAATLGNAAALAPFHRLAITAVGLSPPAVAAGGPGVVGGDCTNVASNAPGATPTVLPPTTTVTAEATVTNCGTVPETGVVVTQTLALADPAGTAPPPPSARGSASRVSVALRSGASMALTLPPLSVASGHLYSLTVQVAVPASQQDTAGSTQQFLLQISG
jgi:hypothetical protein